MFKVSKDFIYTLANEKFEPLYDKISKEYQQTEEYKVVHERKRIQDAYEKARFAFAEKYACDIREYDDCFDVFGHLMNQKYLDEVKRQNLLQIP